MAAITPSMSQVRRWYWWSGSILQTICLSGFLELGCIFPPLLWRNLTSHWNWWCPFQAKTYAVIGFSYMSPLLSEYCHPAWWSLRICFAGGEWTVDWFDTEVPGPLISDRSRSIGNWTGSGLYSTTSSCTDHVRDALFKKKAGLLWTFTQRGGGPTPNPEILGQYF